MVSIIKSCLWLGNVSPPSQTCTHHGGKTDTDTDTNAFSFRLYFKTQQ
jgi:hypothetical protein